MPGVVGATAVGGADHFLHPPPAAPPVRLYCGDTLAVGCNGPVFSGTCNGAPAIVKVFTWDADAHDAYRREVAAYRALARLQGSVVPEVLDYGRMRFGLRYIALRPVEGGQPLSSCEWPFPRAVAKAAVKALQTAHATCEGFVHGDVRLENMLLLRQGAAAGGGTPRCVLLDFEWSRTDGDKEQQEQEQAQLERLLGTGPEQ